LPAPKWASSERYLTVWVFLCIVVGVLIEVPVMLMVANFVNHSRA
jgi:ACR3 family arsenite efflux pump ArsB